MTSDETSTTHVEAPLAKALHKTAVFAATLGVGCVALMIALVAVIHANQASRQSLAGCRLYKTVAEAPLAAQTSQLGLQLAAGARVAYETAGCHLGALEPPDPRVAPLLPAGIR